ncbi:ABC transporter substrate-binding protein [Kitasatospora sp. NPDC001540]|uniref:ABC transporter substrate-binding protein n=1 Tax=Kitasatospora sp. NPDC001540 TaxID=3364014 RepID=UPI0036C7EA8E
MPGASRRALPAVLSVGVLALAACGSPGAGGGGGAGAAGTPRSGGTLTYAVGTDVLCADPQQAGNGDELAAARGLVDSLTAHDPDSGKQVPWLASSWEVGEGARSFTFHLRTGVTFSDGTPLDAQVVKGNFDNVAKLGAHAVQATSYLAGYRSTTVVDPQTVRIDFDQPNAKFLEGTSSPSLGLVAAATLAKSAADRCSEGVIGSGPFTLERFTRNQQVVETPRKDYAWAAANAAHQGPAYLSSLVFKVVPQDGVRSGGLRSGQFDAIGAVGPQDRQPLRAAGYQLLTRAVPGLVYSLNVNVARPATADPAVRTALRLALDRQQIVDTVLGDGSKAATSVLASTTPGYTDLGPKLAADPAGAARLLDGAGWTKGPDGIRAKDGARLTLVAVWFGGAGPVQTSLELAQQQLKAVGVELTLRPIAIAQAIATFKAGDYDLIDGQGSNADPDILRTYYNPQGLNVVRLPAGPLQDLLNSQATEADPAVRAQQVGKAQQQLVDDGYAIPLYEATGVVGLAPRVHGVSFDAASRPQFHDAWLS